MQETQAQFLAQDDLLEEEMATHSSILAWKFTWTEEPGRLESMGSQESDLTENTHIHTHTHKIRDLPSGPVVKTLRFHYTGCGFGP